MCQRRNTAADRLPPSLHGSSKPPDTQQGCTSRSCRQQPLVMILLLSSLAREAIPFPENTRSNFLAFQRSRRPPPLWGSDDAEAARPGRFWERRTQWGRRVPDWLRLGNLLTTLPRAAGLRRLVVVVVGESCDLYLESRGCCEAAQTRTRENHASKCARRQLQRKTHIFTRPGFFSFSTQSRMNVFLPVSTNNRMSGNGNFCKRKCILSICVYLCV